MCSPYAVELARDGLTQSAALLKNANGTLPFRPSGASYTVAVLGPNANLSKAVAGYYGGNSCGGVYRCVYMCV